jgi:uncharacterized protein YbjT (DUF2867 family)
MNLVVGATGYLGREICRVLRTAGKPVRALCRRTAAPEHLRILAELGVEIHYGDLKSPASLGDICANVKTVLSTASSTLSRQPDDSIESVDLRGHLHLVEVARRAEVRHFVFVSFAKQALESPLQTAKRAVENEVIASGMNYTILQPVNFMEVWLGPGLGFDPSHGRVRLLGTGDKKTSWISLADVARFAAAAVDNPTFHGRVLPLGGPAALSMSEVLETFRELGAPSCALEYLTETELLEQLKGAQDPLQQSFAAMMLNTARGQVVDPAPALEINPMELVSVRQYANWTMQDLQNTQR